MSIQDEINRLVNEQRLFCLGSLLYGEETPRTVFVTEELNREFCAPFPDTREGNRLYQARAVLDDFTEGSYITVADRPFDKDPGTILARVNPVEKEVWDFRCLCPNPGIRVLGFFAEQDTFVAVLWDFRENIDNWEELVAECETIWRNLFGNTEPLKGNTLNDYISYNADPS